MKLPVGAPVSSVQTGQYSTSNTLCVTGGTTLTVGPSNSSPASTSSSTRRLARRENARLCFVSMTSSPLVIQDFVSVLTLIISVDNVVMTDGQIIAQLGNWNNIIKRKLIFKLYTLY